LIKFVELFCAIGGFRLGLEACNGKQQRNTEVSRCRDSLGNKGEQSKQSKEWGDYTCVFANDNDKYACQIYRARFGDGELHEGDIRAVDADAIPDHDLLCAGFPCQSFSIAGKRKGFEDTRGTLFFEICRVLRAKRPSYLLLENVKGLLSSDNGATFCTILKSLDDLGYDCQWQVLNSKNFGVPQNRERVFIIGHTRGLPRPKVFPIGESNQDNDELGGTTEERGEGVQTEYLPALRGGEKWSSFISQTLSAGYYKRQHGQTMIQLGLVGEKDNMGQRIYDPDGIACSIRSQGGGQGAKTGLYEIAQALQTDGQLRQGVSWGTDKPQSARNIRRLTPLECERLQSFPDGWTEGVSDTQRYRQLGNAVTTNVVTAIGIQLLAALHEEGKYYL